MSTKKKKPARKAREFILSVGTNIFNDPVVTVERVIGGSLDRSERTIRVREVLPRKRGGKR